MKIVILGSTGTGKSTLGRKLKNKLGMNVIEMDDVITDLNNGVWPTEHELLKILMDKSHKRVMNEKNIVYLVSYLNEKQLKEFYDNGFKIIELHTDFDNLKLRKVERGDFDYLSEKEQKEGHDYYLKLVTSKKIQKLFELSLDTSDMSKEEVYSTVFTLLSKL